MDTPNERQICKDRLELAFLARGTDARGCFFKITGDFGKEGSMMFKVTHSLLTQETIEKIAQELDVDSDWLCGSGPKLPPFGMFEK